MTTPRLLAAPFAFALALAASAASAATCSGPGQVITLVTPTGATCFATAVPGVDGNVSGQPDGANPDPLFARAGTGFVLLDKSDDATSGLRPAALTIANGTLGGSWSIGALLPPPGRLVAELILAFKTGGNAGRISTWAAFTLPQGTASGTWATTGRNALSHANLYARLVEAAAPAPDAPPAPQTPLPAPFPTPTPSSAGTPPATPIPATPTAPASPAASDGPALPVPEAQPLGEPSGPTGIDASLGFGGAPEDTPAPSVNVPDAAPAPVPLPAPGLLLGSILGLLAVARRRRTA